MSTASHDASTPHVTDGELIALLDDERGAVVEIGQRHLDECEACRARLNVLASQSSQVHSALSTILIPSVSEETFRRRIAAGTRRAVPLWRRPAWQAAAAGVILAAAAAAASPVRNWIRRRVEPVPVVRPVSPPPAVTTESQAANRSGASVSFAPAGPTFSVRFDSVPSDGMMDVERTEDVNITARVVNGAGTGGDAMVVLPGELRVRNTTGSRASYRLSLPLTVTRFRAIVGGRIAFDGAAPAAVRLAPIR